MKKNRSVFFAVLVLFLATIVVSISDKADIINTAFGESSVYSPLKLKAVDVSKKRLAMSGTHIVWIRDDGTVVASGKNEFGECAVEDWTDIIKVDAGTWETVGLRSDGTVVATGLLSLDMGELSAWRDITDVSVSPGGLVVGVCKDGTVVSVGPNFGNCDFSNWKDISTISSAFGYAVGLKKDGTVLITGEIEDNRNLLDVLCWKDIVKIDAGPRAIVGLKSDGTVVTTQNQLVQDANQWSGIVDISVGFPHIAGVKEDGSLLIACGDYDSGGGTKEFPEENDVIAVAVNEDFETAMLHRNGTISIKKNGEVNLAPLFNSAEELDRLNSLPSQIKVGDTILFGKYRQSSDWDDPFKKDPIEWLVLDVQDDRALVITKQSFDRMEFEDRKDVITWKNSSVREWLNVHFFNGAFTRDQQSKILTTEIVTYDDDPLTDDPERKTQDKLFLFSKSELEKYFPTEESRKCDATAYTDVMQPSAANWWWLRSPGLATSYALRVKADGSISTASIGSFGSVRPAMWVTLE